MQSQLIDKLLEWSAINTHSFNPSGIEAFTQKLFDEFKILKQDYPELNFQLNKIDLTNNNPAKIFSAKKILESPTLKILFVAHLDTVYPINSGFQKAELLNHEIFGRIIHGPGVADIKGGILLILELIKKIEASELKDLVAWELLLNPDEEIGSIGSNKFLETAALRNDYALVFEPSLPDASFAYRRSGTGNFSLKVIGKSAHVGRCFNEGSSAIVAASKFIIRIHELNSKLNGVILNTGIIEGGSATNVVPETCTAQINIRIEDPDQENLVLNEIEKIKAEIIKEFTSLKDLIFEGKFTRPPKIPDIKTDKIFKLLELSCLELGLQFNKKNTGGCCDGNNLSFFGLPNIDTMGVIGDCIHSEAEFMIVDSFQERLDLAFSLLNKLVVLMTNSQEPE